MNRPVLEVADLVRAAGDGFIERSRRWIRWKHVKVLRAIARCRTAALGGHFNECTDRGQRTTISYNSCRDRHCPKCQTAARDRWIAARRKELLPTRYIHVFFILPRHLAPVVLQYKKVLYDLLFRSSAETLLEVARNPHRLGAEIGFFSVLHSWSQKLEAHPHVHCVVPAGGLSPAHTRSVRSRENYFLPKEVLSEVFRGKFVDASQLNLHNTRVRRKLGGHLQGFTGRAQNSPLPFTPHQERASGKALTFFIGTYLNASTATLYCLLARLREGHKSLQTLWIFGLELAGVKM
jgi:hypothetical protein